MNILKTALAVLISCVVLSISCLAQVPTREQCQQADTELNQVYKQLMGALNDAQKQQLKNAQRQWIKQRDAFVSQNPGNPQGALYQATMQRVGALQGVMNQLSQTPQSQKETIISSKQNEKQNIDEIISNIKICLDSNESIAIQEYRNYLQLPNSREKALKRFQAFDDFAARFNNFKKRDSRDVREVEPVQDEAWIKNYEADHDLSRIWPNENTQQSVDSSSKKSLSVCIQNNITNEVASQCLSKNLSAKSYIGNPEIYIFDSKTGIQLFSYNASHFIRDRNMTPIHLSFSKDGRLLTYTTGYMGLNGCNLNPYYVLNLNSQNFINGQFLSPIFCKNHDGKVSLAPFSDLDDVKDNYSQRLEQWKSIYNKINSEYYNYETPENLLKRFANEDFLKKDSDEITQVRDNNESGPDGYINAYTNSMDAFSIYWPEIFGAANMAFMDFSKYHLTINSKVDKPSTERQNESFNLLSECDNLSVWPFLLGKKCIDTNQSLNGYLNVKNSYKSENVKIYALDLNHQGQQGRTFAVVKTDSNQPLALPEVSTLDEIGNGNLKYEDASLNSSNAPLILPATMWGVYQERFHFLDEKNSRLWLSSSLFGLNNINIKNPRDRVQFEKIPPFQFFAVSDNYIFGVKDRKVPKAELWSKQNQQKVLDLYFGDSGSYEMISPEGYYSGRFKGRPFIAFRSGLNGFPFEQFDLRLNRPDIVLDRLGAPKEAIEAAKTLREKRLKKMNVTEEMLKPDFHLPEVALTSEVPSTTSSDQIDLKIKATDEKYPLERLRVYVNNVPINGTEGESLRDQKTQSLERTIPIKLASGRNKIQVSVLNSAGAESLYANAEVACTAQRPKPTLYVVSMGVSNYANPDNNLKYAAKDAEDLAKKLKDRAGSLYGDVKELVLKDQDVSRENLAKVREFLKPATIDDSVVLFMAGHGLLDDKYDYYFGTSDIDPAHPEKRGIPFEEMDEILASLPCLKKSMLVDTCHAGELDADEKKQLAASDASAQGVPVTTDAGNGAKVAMRAIGTRGMQVKAVEGAKGRNDWYERLQDMFVDLRRGSGSTILSSSEGAEYAYESSDQQNGLFTYALMEALDGKGHPADAKTPEVTMSEVAEYVKKRVGDLTNHKQTPNARRVNLEGDFALGTTK